MAGKRKKKGGDATGAPGWIVTFADLMSLLLTFFILILSFAEIDASKFKRVMGSIKMAFGVQKQQVFEFVETSRNPLEQKSHGKDSKKIISTKMNDHVLNVNANDLCGMEEKNKQIASERAEYARNELHKKLTSTTRLSKYFNILLDEDRGQLRLGLKPEYFFHKGTSKIKKERIKDLSYLFNKLAEEKLKISITNQADSLKSKKSFNSWKLTSDRSLVLAYISQKFPQSKNHNITVNSLTEKVDSDLEDIEFNINFKKEYLDEQ